MNLSLHNDEADESLKALDEMKENDENEGDHFFDVNAPPVEDLGDVGDDGGVGRPDEERPVIDLHGEQRLPDVQLVLGDLDNRVVVLVVPLSGPLSPTNIMYRYV